MLEAARYEERARSHDRLAQQEEARFAAERATDAERRARLATGAKHMEEERLAREAAAAEEARRRIAAERAAASDRVVAAEAAARNAAAAAAQQAEAERALESARRQLAQAQSAREAAERDSRSARGGLADFDHRLQRVVDEVRKHEQAAASARSALKLAEDDERAALAVKAESEGVASRFKGWLAGDSGAVPTVTAVAQAAGRATSTPVVETHRFRGPTESIRVDAVGEAKVALVDSATTVPGGRANAAIEAHSAVGGGAVSDIKMAESARDIAGGGARAVGLGAAGQAQQASKRGWW